MVDINYLDYSVDLFAKAIVNSPAKIYVFPDYNNKLRAEEVYEQPLLEQSSQFLTMGELKEKLFPGDRLVLKEEKLSVIFYKLLTESEKEVLAVDDYFDVIDLAGDFFHFYGELNEYDVKQVKGLKEWQADKYRIFRDIRQRYIDYMQEAGYSDRTLNYRRENFSSHYLRDYEEVVFVNIVNFTLREKQMLTEVEGIGKKISLYLQLFPDDFDEEKLRLKSVTLPEEVEVDIEIYHSSEELLQIVYMLAEIVGGQDTILNADDNSNYHHLLSSLQVEVNREPDFTRTAIYKFLESHYELLINADTKDGSFRLRLEDLIKYCSRQVMKNYYRLQEQDLQKLYRLAGDDYVYFDRSLGETGAGKFRLLLEEIEHIRQFEDITDFCTYLENLNLKLLNDREYKDNYTQFFDALAELKSLAGMDLVSSWSDFFNNRARGLFRLILNYLRYKEVERISDSDGIRAEIMDLSCAAHSKHDRLIILNANNANLPSLPAKDFLLSESQREEIGLPLNRDRRLQQKYDFYRHILNSKRAIIFYQENLEEDKTASPFVEELKLNYGLESKSLRIKEGNYPEVIRSIFTPEQGLYNYLQQENRKDDILKVEAGDFPGEGLALNYYKYKCLKDCYYRFYLEQIKGLEEEWVESKNKLSLKVLGTIVHEMFADIMGELKNKVDECGFRAETELIKEIVLKKIDKYELKIPGYYRCYYEKIIIPHIQQSIKAFFDRIRRKTGDRVDEVLTEWSPWTYRNFFVHDRVNFYLTGRIDLIINSGETTHLIDYKTGTGETDQLDFYYLLLKSSLRGDSAVKKYFYSVMKQRLNESFTDPLKLEEKLTEELEEFINGEKYSAVYKSRCKNCNYLDICRVVIR